LFLSREAGGLARDLEHAMLFYAHKDMGTTGETLFESVDNFWYMGTSQTTKLHASEVIHSIVSVLLI